MRMQINDMIFEWDDAKAEANLKNHGVSFEEAATVFNDENAYVYADKDHSDGEERFTIVGNSELFRLLLVCHCMRESDTVFRIISAWEAEKKRRDEYLRRGGAKL